MTLSELRNRWRVWMDLENQPGLSSERIDGFLRLAYQDVTIEVDKMPAAWNGQAESEAVTLTLAAATREYPLTGEPSGPRDKSARPRRILSVYPKNTDASLDPPLRIVPYAERNDARWGGGVYVYRDGQDRFVVGLVNMPPEYTQLAVFWLPELTLVSDGDTPHQVPSAHHELIAIRAALIAKLPKAREPQLLAALWDDGLVRMRRSLAEMTGRGEATTY